MIVAILADLHGNKVSLRVVIDDLERLRRLLHEASVEQERFGFALVYS